MAKHPFVVVLFLDYMYLDFYERIEERLVKLRELAETYSGYVWFASARIEMNELAREKYVGNVWGEEEVRGFINGKLSFKSARQIYFIALPRQNPMCSVIVIHSTPEGWEV